MEAWKEELYHYGMPRRSGRYPWGSGDNPRQSLNKGRKTRKSLKKENNEETKEKKSLTDKQKKYIKIGAAVAGTALVAYGAYKVGKMVNNKNAVKQGEKLVNELHFNPHNVLANPNSFSKAERKMAQDMLNGSRLPKDLGGVTNPKKLTNNCKDVSEATLKRWLGVDPSAVAGEKSVVGNLHDFVEKRGYNKAGIQWLGETGGIIPDPSGDSSKRVTNQILKHFKEGDCGMISVSWDPKKVIRSGNEDGHAFNWLISKGKVVFIDDQPDPPLTDAIKHLSRVDPNVEIEVVKIMKEAFAK